MKELFEGKLIFYLHEKFDLTLKKGTKPMHQRPYPGPYKSKEIFKQELKHLYEEDILPPFGVTQCVLSKFILLKKDDHVHWVSNF